MSINDPQNMNVGVSPDPTAPPAPPKRRIGTRVVAGAIAAVSLMFVGVCLHVMSSAYMVFVDMGTEVPELTQFLLRMFPSGYYVLGGGLAAATLIKEHIRSETVRNVLNAVAILLLGAAMTAFVVGLWGPFISLH
jgi:succinate dehydrogenase hydrophobic anchor subunit